eukprot:SAG31_NODE_3268_length_4478_cov_2.701987_7_plen_40_part_00
MQHAAGAGAGGAQSEEGARMGSKGGMQRRVYEKGAHHAF